MRLLFGKTRLYQGGNRPCLAGTAGAEPYLKRYTRSSVAARPLPVLTSIKMSQSGGLGCMIYGCGGVAQSHLRADSHRPARHQLLALWRAWRLKCVILWYSVVDIEPHETMKSAS